MHGFSALFGAILGFLAAITPEIIQMLKDRFSHRRELEAKRQELDAATKGFEYAIRGQSDTIAAQAAQIALLSERSVPTPAPVAAPDPQPTTEDEDDVCGHIVLQFLRSSVRPIVTYGFFLLFAAVKIIALRHGLHDGTPVTQLMPLIWDEDSESLFAAVITFWFGSRAVNSITKQKAVDERKPSSIKGTSNVVGE